jgi:hypothetical protein
MPVGQNKWEAVAVMYNKETLQAGRNEREASFLRQFYMDCLKEGSHKPAGNPNKLWKVQEAQEIYWDISNMMVMGFFWDDGLSQEDLDEEVQEEEDEAVSDVTTNSNKSPTPTKLSLRV